ncbi:MAG: flagellar hook-length control protein FliK [Ramlibacter sp.]
MTPVALQTLAPAAPAQNDPARRAAPGDEPATFATILDGSVRALSGDGEPAEREVHASTTIEARGEAGADASPVQAGPEVTVLASDQPWLDALALMLSTAPAPPGQATPGAAAATTAGAGTTAAVSDALAAAAQARAVFDGTAAPTSRRMPAQAPAAHPDGGHRARAAAAPPGLAETDLAADLARAEVAASPGALRREAHAAPAQSRQVPASAAADEVNGTDTAGHPRPAGAAAASATTLSVVAGMQDSTDAAQTTIDKGGPLAASPATPAAVQRLSADPEVGAAAASATRALQRGPVAAQDAPPVPAQAPAATDLPGPGMAVAAASAPASPGAVAQLAPPVGSADWAPALAQQLVRLPGGGAVELNLNPVELGPLQVKLSVVEGQAQVLFVAEHAAVRQALEAALPQLRSSLAESGISLGQASVGAGAGEQQTGQDRGERPGGGERAAAGQERGPAKPPGATPRSGRAGAVDTFA